MKRLFLLLCVVTCAVTTALAQRSTDRLDRGLVAMKVSGGVYINWRILAEEYYDVTYNVYRDGTKLNDEPLSVSNFTDKGGTTTSSYTVRAVTAAGEQQACKAVTPWSTSYKEIQLKHEGIASTLVPNDATAADVDGDGELEIIMKFDNLSEMEQSYPRNGPTVNGKVTGEYTIFECFKLDGTRLWWINCGPNMADFQNNEQNIAVFDWDGDGKAEAVMRAADGTVVHKADGTTYTVGNKSNNVRAATGGGVNWFVTTTEEYLLYLNGETGDVYDCIRYPLALLESGESNINDAWGDGSGHRASKHFFGAPYLDGRKPSIFIARGIYTRHKMAAYDVNLNTHKLTLRWRWYNNTWGPWKGQGYHNYAIADVDMDGRDEIVFGSMVIDDNGKGLSTTGFGHGDAETVADLNPYIHGLEIYACMEDQPGNNYRDATTSKVYHRFMAGNDDGRAIAGNFTNQFPGGLGCSAREGAISTVKNTAINGLEAVGVNTNMRIYWDGDLCSETFNYINGKNTAGCVAKYGSWTPIYTMDGSMTNNDTKGTPCFQGDILGDWREEVIMRTANNNIRIYSTPTATSYRIPSLWYDHQYRNAMVWQMNGYNQPPNISYFLGQLEGITVAPPPLTMTGRTEVKTGGTIGSSLNGQHVIVCETSDSEVTLEEGAQPAVLTFNVPSWVQGTAGSESTTQNPKINYTYYTCNVNGGGLSGGARLVKQGDGTLQLPAATFAHTGNTDVWEGTLRFDGTMPHSSLWLNRHTTLVSEGGTFHDIKADYGSAITVGSGDTPSTLTVDELSLGFGSRLVVDVYSDGFKADVVKAKKIVIERKTGTAWTQGGPEFLMPIVELKPHLAEGEQKLAVGKYIIAEADEFVGSTDDLILKGAETQKKNVYIEDGRLVVEVIGMRDTGAIRWNGTTGNRWDDGDSENFVIGDDNEHTIFVAGDEVTFDDGATIKSVNITANVYPAKITVDATSSYSISGTGAISGSAQLVKENSGTLTLLGEHSYTGGNHLRGGTTTVKKLANQYSATGNLGAVTTKAELFTIEDGAVLQTTAAVEQGSPMQMIGEVGGVISNSADFIAAKAISGTRLTKRGTGWLKLSTANSSLSELVVEAGVVQNASTPAKTVTLSGGEIRDNGGTSYTINVPEKKNGTWYMANRASYTNKITGQGKLTAYCVTEKGGSNPNYWYATRTQVACNFSEFEGTLVPTSSLDDANNLRFTLNTSSGMPKGAMEIGSKVVVQNTGRSFHIGKVTGEGRLGGGCTFSNGATVGANTWVIGNDDNWTTKVRVTADSHLQKVGSGTVTWSAACDHTGSTTVKEGTLKLTSGSQLGTGSLTIESGATLCGTTSSSIPLKNSAVYVRSGGAIMAGATAGAISGTLYFGGRNVTISEGAFLDLTFYRKASSATTGGTSVQNIGTLTLDGTIRIYYPETGISVEAGDSVVLWKDVASVKGTPRLETTVIDAARGLAWDTTDLARGILRVVYDPTIIPTSILAPRTSNLVPLTSDDALYDLQGRRVSEPAPKGIYIRRGKTVVIK